MVICAITFVSPYYDCDEKWILVFEDTLIIPSNHDVPVVGHAVDTTILPHNPISQFYPSIRFNDHREWLAVGIVERDACYNGICYSVLWHEIKHLMCDCDWHEDMETYLPPGEWLKK